MSLGREDEEEANDGVDASCGMRRPPRIASEGSGAGWCQPPCPAWSTLMPADVSAM